jgi:hypothetical protein
MCTQFMVSLNPETISTLSESCGESCLNTETAAYDGNFTVTPMEPYWAINREYSRGQGGLIHFVLVGEWGVHE